MSGLRMRTLAIAVLAAAGLAAPLVWSHPFVLHIAIQALIWALFAASWDLLSGYTGQVSFGHAGFFSIGAYTAAILSKVAGLSSPGNQALILSASGSVSAFRRSACAATISRW